MLFTRPHRHDGIEYVDLPWMLDFEPVIPLRWALVPFAAVTAAFLSSPGFSIEFEGLDPAQLDPTRSLIVTNHTHKLDWLPPRYAIYQRGGVEISSWIKMRGFDEHPAQRVFLCKTGNLPLSSRGYVLILDHIELFGRHPTEDEYRILRAHIERRAPLPDSAWARAISQTPRRMAGWYFEPSANPYRQAVMRAYEEMMAVTLRLARRAMRHGRVNHIYPEGSVSSRLCPGRHGALQAALALGLDIVPVGVSGMREAFPDGLRPAPGATVHVRIGEPIPVDRSRYDGFRPFYWEHERAWHATLREDTAAFMEQLNALLEPAYRWMPDRIPDGKWGIRRFVP